MSGAPLFNPFPGLRPFEADEDHLFFGREKSIDELLRRLRTTRFLSIVGSSGSGKSSLVRSGLIPSLQSGFMVQAGSSWRVAVFRPGEDPVGHMAAALATSDVLGTNEELADTNRVLTEATLRRSSLGLAEAVRLARLPVGDNLLLIVDQFEELFRFKHNRRIRNSSDESAAFVKLLLEAARQTAVPVYVALTMRSDFIGDCMEYQGLPEAVNDGQYLVPRMTRDELRSAITGPVAVGGGAITPRLVTRLLNDVGDDPDQLPVLQHALMRTWDHWEAARHLDEPIDLPHYEAVGTLHDALSRHAEEAYADLGAGEGQAVAEVLFRALTDTVSDSRGVRRPTSVEEVAAMAGVDVAAVVTVADVFRRHGRTFLMPPPGVALGPHSILDISHESLMRRWTRLMEWAEQERVSAEFYARLTRAATWHDEGTAGLWRDPELALGLRWLEENRPNAAWAARYDPHFDRAALFLEQSRQERDRLLAQTERERRAKLRRAWQTAGALGTLLILAAMLAVYAWRQQVRAEQNRARADENLNLAKTAVDEMLASAGRQSARVVAAVPELEEFRRELLEKARVFYAQFGQQRPDSETLQSEIARAHFRLGDIYRLMQRTDDARREYGTAIERFGELVRDYPAKPEYRQALANVHNWLGELLRPVEGESAAAEKAYETALTLQAQLQQEFPDEPVYRQERARTSYNRGILRSERGVAAGDDYREAIRLLEPLAVAGRPSARQELGRALNNYGLWLAAEHRLADARDAMERAIAIHEALVGSEPANREYRLEMAKFYDNLAIVLVEQNELAAAQESNAKAMALVEGLARPVPSLASELAHTRNLRGRILEFRGRYADAGADYQASVDLYTTLAEGSAVGDGPEFDLRFGEALYDLAGWQVRSGDLAGAARSLTDAVARHSVALAHRTNLAYDYLMLARVELRRGARADAVRAADRLADLMASLTPENRGPLEGPYQELRAQLR